MIVQNRIVRILLVSPRTHSWIAGILFPCMASAAPLLEQDVLPILQKNCMGCHGGLIQKGELDLRTLPLMLKGGKAGPAVVAGKPEESELWLAIAENEMPKEKPPLSAKDKATLKAWIAAGLPTYVPTRKML